MRRIALIGCPGAGKTTLAQALGDQLDLPVIHLDRHFWKPGWVETPREPWQKHQKKLLSGDRWIVDGGYHATLDIRLPRADTVLCFDFPRWRSYWGVARRWMQHHGQTRPDLGEGCPERLDPEFLRYIWNFPRDIRPKVFDKVAQDRDGKRVEVFRAPLDVRRFVAAL